MSDNVERRFETDIYIRTYTNLRISHGNVHEISVFITCHFLLFFIRGGNAATSTASIFPLYIKGKAVPLQAWSGPEGSRKFRFPDLMTTAQDGGKVVSLTQRPPLPPGNPPGSHFC